MRGWEEWDAQVDNSEDEDILLDNVTATSWDEQEWAW